MRDEPISLAEEEGEDMVVDRVVDRADEAVEDEPVSDEDAAEEVEEEVDAVMLNWLCTKEEKRTKVSIRSFVHI